MCPHAGASFDVKGSDETMTTIYDTDDDGNMMVVFDTRWQFPELLGFSPDDPQYKSLQRMWERATGKTIGEDYTNGRTEEERRQGK